MRPATIHRFWSDARGNVALTFSLLLLPVMLSIGAAIDYTQANAARTAMQSAVDATALNLSKEATGLSAAQITQKGTKYFKANFDRPKVGGVKVTSILDDGDTSKLTVTASGTVPTNFLGLFGFKTLKIGADSVVKWGATRLRVALVLDNTGSMASAGKMAALQSAARSFIGQMQGAAIVNGDVYVSIIPFANDVNVGKSNYSASWVDFKPRKKFDAWDDINGSCSVGGANNNADCTKLKGTWTPANHSTWNGCVTDRDKNYDSTNTAPTASNQATLFPAEQEPACPVEILPLTYDWSALKAKIDSMVPAGNTNQSIGLQWGFQSLTSAPLSIPAKDPKYKYQDVIILLTDGLNTQSRFTKFDPMIDTILLKQKEVDQRTLEACKNIKAANITLYAVQVNTDGDVTSQMLKDCASGPDKFFLLTSASQIVDTFNQIGTGISKRRIAQ